MHKHLSYFALFGALAASQSFAASGTSVQAAVAPAGSVMTQVASISSVDKSIGAHEEVISTLQPIPVNPMTGKSIRYEEMEHVLREKTLEAHIAEQELAAAKSRNDERKLSGEHAASDQAAIVKVPDAVKNFPMKTESPAKSTKRKSSSGKITAGVSSSGTVAPSFVPERPRFVGLMESGSERIAMVSYAGHTVAVKEGTSAGGVSVGAVSGNAATINGVSTVLEKTVSSINLPETHHPVQPGTSQAQMQGQPMRGVVVQGVNTAAMQPVAPGASLPGATTQPVHFPNDLYSR